MCKSEKKVSDFLKIHLNASMFSFQDRNIRHKSFHNFVPVFCSECRSLLLTNVSRHLRYHLGQRDELRLCMDILSEILSFLYHKSKNPDSVSSSVFEIILKFGISMKNISSGLQGSSTLQQEIRIVCLSSLDMLIQTVLLSMDRSAPILVTK